MEKKPAIYKEVTPSGETLVYMNGALLYKKWSAGHSLVFEKYGIQTSNSDRDRGSY